MTNEKDQTFEDAIIQAHGEFKMTKDNPHSANYEAHSPFMFWRAACLWAREFTLAEQAKTKYLKDDSADSLEFCMISALNNKLTAERTRAEALVAELDKIASSRCAWQLSQEIAKTAIDQYRSSQAEGG